MSILPESHYTVTTTSQRCHCTTVARNNTFKRISLEKDGNINQMRTVELTFVSSKILSHISVVNVIFEVKPNIRDNRVRGASQG